jgi:hypothetical protein
MTIYVKPEADFKGGSKEVWDTTFYWNKHKPNTALRPEMEGYEALTFFVTIGTRFLHCGSKVSPATAQLADFEATVTNPEFAADLGPAIDAAISDTLKKHGFSAGEGK